MASLVKEKRGAVTVQVALFLPILIIILIGAFEVWKVMYLQQVLNDAAYQGVRLMVTQAVAPAPVVDGAPQDMRGEMILMIERYVRQAAFIDPAFRELGPDASLVQVQLNVQDFPPPCDSSVEVVVLMPWLVGREFVDRPGLVAWMPFLQRVWARCGAPPGELYSVCAKRT